MRINEYFARGERRIFRNLSFREFFNFKGQDIRHLESFAWLKMFPIFPGIQFLNVRLRGMKTLGHEFQ